MRSLRAASLSSLCLLLSCALPPGALPPIEGLPAQEEGDFEPIRFGDAEELTYTAEFFPGANYDASIPTPDSLLHQKHGTRLAHHAEVLESFRKWAETSERVTLTNFGKTHEGRDLVYAVITSPANHARIDEIRAQHARLADPRGLSESDASELVDSVLPIAWMGYSIHGDELSGTDASLAMAYHLAACTDGDVMGMLDEMVIIVDPCLNPDGRERIIGMVEQSAGYTPNLDYASMHRGRWPYGRGNHYLFDMNRDWMGGTQPETEARWSAILDWNPQLFVDAHEMGSLDTFLFYPQSDPINPHLPEKTIFWQGAFAADAGQAFDELGWSYYTREWADGWAPFYSDAWGSLVGAVGILYEQASTYGFQLRRASGELLTYREAVHHQVLASMANLSTLRNNQRAILNDYAENRRENIAAETPGNELTLAVRPENNPSRLRELRRVLDGQGIEYSALPEGGTLSSARGARGGEADELELPAGTLVIPARQPQRPLVRAFFDFDQQIDLETLKKEREELERKNSSKMYDLTAWSLPHAYDLDAWWGELAPAKTTEPEPLSRGGLEDATTRPGATPYGWAVDGHDDSAVAFASRAMELGLQLNFADREFEMNGRTWSRGSLLVRRNENGGEATEIEARIERAARAAGASASRLFTGRAPGDGPDLGGGHFHLLARPRVALISNSPVSSTRYGHIWHHLDTRLGVPFSIIDAQGMRRQDLRRYNVIVLPPGGLDGVIGKMKDDLLEWVQSGGTLIASEGSAAMLTSGRLGLSSVTLRRDALEELDVYARAVARERSSREVSIDLEHLWNGKPTPALTAEEGSEEETTDGEKKGPKPDEVPIEERDRWMRRFSPSGANLLAELDDESWLTVGFQEQAPLAFSGSSVYLSKAPAQTPVRFAPALDLRLAGLVWPEARERIADSAYLTRERRGNGQIILFAGPPVYRGYHLATARLLSNAVIYGPGLGASQPVGW